MEQPMPTHFEARANAVARLDRIHSSLASWVVRLVSAQASVREDPKQFLKGLSDHYPVLAAARHAARTRAVDQRLAPHIAEHRRFREVAGILLQVAKSDGLPTFERHAVHKRALREAGRIVRKELFQQSQPDPHTDVMALSAVARAACMGDTRLAKSLMSKCLVARRFLLVHNGSAILCDPAEFARLNV